MFLFYKLYFYIFQDLNTYLEDKVYIVGYHISIADFLIYKVFNTTFNNISAISWQSVLLVEETGGPGENHRPFASH
jgi:glutathione S-transferase